MCSVSSNAALTAGVASARTAKASTYFGMAPLTESPAQTFTDQALAISRRRRVGIQRARVDGHTDDGVDAEGVEVVDLTLRADPPGRRHAARRRVPDRQDRLQVRPAHQPFGVDVGVEKLVAVRLQRADGLRGGQRQGRLPAVNHDMSVAAVDGSDDALATDGVAEPPRECEVGLSTLEER